jgi:7-cyano-7-deazaguanine synthase
MMNSNNSAVVVLSGGQDSCTCLAMACKNYSTVHALGFNYGQRHAVELECAQAICDYYNVPFKVVQLQGLRDTVTSALTTKDQSVNEAHPRMTNLPASFVPARNALFLTLAHAFAGEIGALHVIAGMCQTDYSGYPDCRRAFIDQLQTALNTGYETNIQIHTPLMYLTKAESFELADNYGALETIIEFSHTCYNGDREHKHAWGYGCGECPACKLRARGYEEFVMAL